MSIKKKMTDFVRLEQGSIGQKAAMVTGAAMVAIVLAAAAGVGEAKAAGGPSEHININYPHQNSMDYSNPGVIPHTNVTRHANVDPYGIYP